MGGSAVPLLSGELEEPTSFDGVATEALVAQVIVHRQIVLACWRATRVRMSLEQANNV